MVSVPLTLRVVFPDRETTLVTVRSTDTPRTVALSGPPLSHPVILLHNGACLCPYLSLGTQGVVDGDIIVLHVVQTAPQRILPETDRSDDIFNEVLRLADVAFIPYETSPYGGIVYQQMAAEDREEEQSDEIEVTTVGKKAEEISTTKLPVCWKERPSKGSSQIRSRTFTQKRKPLGNGSFVD